MGCGWCELAVGEPRQRSECGKAGLGEELLVGLAPGAAEADGCAGRDWSAGRVSGTRLVGARLG